MNISINDLFHNKVDITGTYEDGLVIPIDIGLKVEDVKGHSFEELQAIYSLESFYVYIEGFHSAGEDIHLIAQRHFKRMFNCWKSAVDKMSPNTKFHPESKDNNNTFGMNLVKSKYENYLYVLEVQCYASDTGFMVQ